MKIRINGIFGQYDSIIDLSKKCVILIGENGVGKSTILNILNCILEKRFDDLITYYFNSIDFVDETTTINIMYKDIALKKEYILSVLNDKNLYEEFFEFLNYNLENNIQNLLSFNKKRLKKVSKNFAGIDYLLSVLKDTFDKEDTNNEIGCFKNSTLYNKKEQIIKFLDKLKYKNIIYVNMASDYEVINDIDASYCINEEESGILQNNNTKESMLNTKYIDPIEEYKKHVDNNFQNLIKNNIYLFDYDFYSDIKRGEINLGIFLFNNVFSRNILDEFQNRYYTFLRENVGQTIIQEKSMTDIEFNVLKLTLLPLLPKNSIFARILDNNTNDFWNNYGEDYYLLAKFKKNIMPWLMEIYNKKLKGLNDVLSKYFTNKQVVVTPFGVCISSTNNYDNDLDFELLSYGERRVILLMILTHFSNDSIVLLDEPETSLSIVWQKQLVPDIINNQNSRNIVVATQSPFIVDTEELIEYIKCLPMEEKNEQ